MMPSSLAARIERAARNALEAADKCGERENTTGLCEDMLAPGEEQAKMMLLVAADLISRPPKSAVCDVHFWHAINAVIALAPNEWRKTVQWRLYRQVFMNTGLPVTVRAVVLEGYFLAGGSLNAAEKEKLRDVLEECVT